MKLTCNYLLYFILILLSNQVKPYCCTLYSHSRVIHSADITTLQLAQVIFRHGDRTPFENTYPLDPYNDLKYWPDGWAQLTKKGKMMHYELGKYLKWRYSGFLSKSYSKTEVYVRSSDTDRTIMSADVNMAGLFPPTFEDKTSMWNPLIPWQPIPIHTIPSDIDNLIRFGATCLRYNQIYEALHKSVIVQNINKENKKLYDYLSENTGLDIVDYRKVGILYDTLFIQQLNNLTLPDWTKLVFPEKMIKLAIMEFEMVSYTDEMKKLIGGPLLTDLIHNMDLIINPPKILPKNFHSAKLQIYSGHDTTISVLLSILGIYDKKHIPPYATTIMIELHKAKFDDDSDKEEYFVRVYYYNVTNTYPLEFQIPNCITEGSKGVCTLKNFKNVLKHLIITDWKNDCEIQTSITETEGQTFYNRLSMATAVVFFGLVILLGSVVIALGILSIYILIRQLKRNFKHRRNLESIFTIPTNSTHEEHL